MRGRCLLAMSSSPSNQCLPCVTRQVTYAEYRQACYYFLPLNQLHQFNQRMLHIDLVNQLSLKQITVFRMLCFWSHFYSQICKESGRYYLIYCKADSSSKCNSRWLLGVTYFHPEEYLVWGSVSKHFSRAMVKFLNCCQHLRLRNVSQFHALGEILSQ